MGIQAGRRIGRSDHPCHLSVGHSRHSTSLFQHQYPNNLYNNKLEYRYIHIYILKTNKLKLCKKIN